jgi:hypothetical protein
MNQLLRPLFLLKSKLSVVRGLLSPCYGVKSKVYLFCGDNVHP